MTQVFQDITQTIGHTPLVRLSRLTAGLKVELLGKLEFFNPGGSIKDRIGLSMIEEAERKGCLKPGSLIVEPTSGNTGIALALVCAVRGYSLILTMPDSMSQDRRALLRALGAKVVTTPANQGMRGSVIRAEEIAAQTPGAFIPQQFKNPANPQAHYKTTGREIWEDTGGKIDILVSGVGTGGTLTGTGKFLKKRKPQVQIVAVEPASSPVLSGGKPGLHTIQGIGAGFIPAVLDLELIDTIIQIKDSEAQEMTRRLIKEEGILAGISSGAAVYAALRLAKLPENKSKVIVVIIPDSAERYLSTDLFSS